MSERYDDPGRYIGPIFMSPAPVRDDVGKEKHTRAKGNHWDVYAATIADAVYSLSDEVESLVDLATANATHTTLNAAEQMEDIGYEISNRLDFFQKLIGMKVDYLNRADAHE